MQAVGVAEDNIFKKRKDDDVRPHKRCCLLSTRHSGGLVPSDSSRRWLWYRNVHFIGLIMGFYFLQESFKRRMKEKKKRMKVSENVLLFLNSFWKQLNVKGFYNNSFWNLNTHIHRSFERQWVEFIHKVVSFSWQWLNGLYLVPAKSCIHSQWMCIYIMQITQIFMAVN